MFAAQLTVNFICSIVVIFYNMLRGNSVAARGMLGGLIRSQQV